MSCSDPRGVRNAWPRELPGLTAVVDLDAKKVRRVVDEGGGPLPEIRADYDRTALGPSRQVPAPMRVDQPLGVGYRIDGQVVEWQKWRFHFRADQRVGAVVSTVTYGDGESRRQVLYQGSLSEIFVP